MIKQMQFWRLPALAAVLLSALVGCHRGGGLPSGDATAGTGEQRVFHYGYQHGGATFLKARGILDKRLAAKGYRVEYTEFPAGPQLLEALAVGSVDLGSTGESPAIFSQAAGTPLAYVANIPTGNDSGEGQAILVPQNSPIKTIQDLRGKKIAFQKASAAHNFVIQIVERAGLTYKDIQPVYLSPPDARAAFDSGSIDGWAIWDPFLTIAQQKTGGRILVNSKGIKSAGGFYLSTRDFVSKHLDLLKIALQEISDANAWAYDHQDEAAKLYHANTGIDEAIWKMVQKHAVRTGITAVTDKVIEAQQLTADNYYKIGLLPKRIDVRECALTPEQYAQIIPVELQSAQVTRATH